MRILLALVLAAGVTAGYSSDASAKKGKSQRCMATQIDGKKAEFKCKAGQKCCFDYVLNKGTCKPAKELCLL